ncbi:hypothetical protein [Phycicoccus sonneratiae]|uniref:Uncharacterized protein n=1 Tax=Phycicoccus sonneratiae TaxID=2807628 RepID=A0ABS2CK98_9MICO|nr:hypothetical protein [Phycicoccus sonneraticus]MBM6400309.1 hypothetical protein [Phycicoccus sonneraticus]
MSLSTTIATGTLLGAVLAGGVYAATAPSDQVSATVPVAPTFAPVPTPTVTKLADCLKPAKLEHGICVTHKPGPTVTLPASTGSTTRTTSSNARTAPPSTHAPTTGPTSGPVTDDDDHGDDDEHGDDDDHDEDEDHGGDHDDD